MIIKSLRNLGVGLSLMSTENLATPPLNVLKRYQTLAKGSSSHLVSEPKFDLAVARQPESVSFDQQMERNAVIRPFLCRRQPDRNELEQRLTTTSNSSGPDEKHNSLGVYPRKVGQTLFQCFPVVPKIVRELELSGKNLKKRFFGFKSGRSELEEPVRMRRRLPD